LGLTEIMPAANVFSWRLYYFS